MAKKKKNKGRGTAMDTSTTASPSSLPPFSEAMDTTEVAVSSRVSQSTKSTSGSKGLQIQRIMKKGPQKRRAVKIRKQKSIERALLVMDKQQEKLQRTEVKTERVQSLKNLY